MLGVVEDLRSIIIARVFLSAGFQVAQNVIARLFEGATMYQYVCCKSQAETGLLWMRRVDAHNKSPRVGMHTTDRIRISYRRCMNNKSVQVGSFSPVTRDPLFIVIKTD